ncbi:Prefoldin beta-like protein [Ceratobasidium sp. AG-I]|nr:Prefoldin beta-like protein [Ceratobasidium sp. AG-I]
MAAKQLTDQEIQVRFSRFQNDLQQLAQKIGELESEAEEHELVLATLSDPFTNDPDRKCFRMIGGVLVERTVKDVVPSLEMNRNGLKGVLEALVRQYKTKEEDFNAFQREHKIRAANSR